jgi:hypothetical protein
VATLKTSAFNLTETLINTIRVYRTQGAILATESKQSSRIEICLKCPNLGENSRCNLCGCFMNLKVRLEASKCPANHW